MELLLSNIFEHVNCYICRKIVQRGTKSQATDNGVCNINF